MKYLILIVCLGLCGCQAWQGSHSLPGAGLTKQQKRIVENVDNDPFPSPQQVGIHGE